MGRAPRGAYERDAGAALVSSAPFPRRDNPLVPPPKPAHARHMSKTLEQLQREVDKVEPLLRRRVWAPITSQLIPSVLAKADRLIRELELCTDGEEAVCIELLSHLVFLRKDFRRVEPLPASKTIHGGRWILLQSRPMRSGGRFSERSRRGRGARP